jgi:hypothetical protein
MTGRATEKIPPEARLPVNTTAIMIGSAGVAATTDRTVSPVLGPGSLATRPGGNRANVTAETAKVVASRANAGAGPLVATTAAPRGAAR